MKDNKYQNLLALLRSSKDPGLVIVSFLKQLESEFKAMVGMTPSKPPVVPTRKEFEAMIKSLIPPVQNNKPTRRELENIIIPLIPDPIAPEEISDYRLISLIRPLIPKVRNGIDAVVDYEKIRNLTLSELKKDYTTIKEMVLREIQIPPQLTGSDIVRLINRLPLTSEAMIDDAHIKNKSKTSLGMVIPMGGGGAGTGSLSGVGLWSTPSETPAADGSVVDFTVGATPPTDVIADGSVYFSGKGYTHSTSTGKITFDIGGAGPTQFVRFR